MMLSQLYNLLIDIPLCYPYSVSVGTKDAEGGYGWHRFADVSIFKVGEKCRKCGWSTIDGTDEDFDKSPCSRHSWEHDEKCIFSSRIYEQNGIKNLQEFIRLLNEQNGTAKKMKTIQQRAKEYSNYTACKGEREAFAAGASSIIDELKTVMSVSEEQHLRTNIEKMIKILEDEQ